MGKTARPALTRGIVAVRADADGNPTTILNELQRTFAAFRQTNDQRLDELSRGQEDVVRSEQVDRMNTELGRLQAALDEQATQMAALRLGGGTAAGPVDAEYTTAFQAYFRRESVSAALTRGNDAEGGYLAPVEWNRTITDRLIQISPMRQIARVQSISGSGFRDLFHLGGWGSGWVGETAARPQTTTGTLAPLDFETGELYANPGASQRMLDDAEINLEQWIADKVETEFARQEGIAFVAGDGVNKPRGFLTYATGGTAAAVHPFGPIPVKAAGSTTAITTDNLIDLIYALPQPLRGNARFVMANDTIALTRKLKDTTGAYLWQPSIQAGEPQQLLGYSVTEMPDMPVPAANALPVAFGDFQRGYLIVDRTGIRVLRDAYTNKPFVHFYCTKRVGGGVVDPTALRVLRMAAA